MEYGISKRVSLDALHRLSATIPPATVASASSTLMGDGECSLLNKAKERTRSLALLKILWAIRVIDAVQCIWGRIRSATGVGGRRRVSTAEEEGEYIDPVADVELPIVIGIACVFARAWEGSSTEQVSEITDDVADIDRSILIAVSTNEFRFGLSNDDVAAGRIGLGASTETDDAKGPGSIRQRIRDILGRRSNKRFDHQSPELDSNGGVVDGIAPG